MASFYPSIKMAKQNLTVISLVTRVHHEKLESPASVRLRVRRGEAGRHTAREGHVQRHLEEQGRVTSCGRSAGHGMVSVDSLQVFKHEEKNTLERSIAL
jgi:hypothetical protein